MNHSIISNDVFSGGLTCVDEKLIRDSRMINVMNGSCKNGGQDLQICEDSLQKKKGGLSLHVYFPLTSYSSC